MAKVKERHHVIPRVRCRELGIPPNFNGNVRKVSVSKHRAWHTLFGAMTPNEAIEAIGREWSLSADAQEEFARLTGNVQLMKRKQP